MFFQFLKLKNAIKTIVITHWNDRSVDIFRVKLNGLNRRYFANTKNLNTF